MDKRARMSSGAITRLARACAQAQDDAWLARLSEWRAAGESERESIRADIDRECQRIARTYYQALEAQALEFIPA